MGTVRAVHLRFLAGVFLAWGCAICACVSTPGGPGPGTRKASGSAADADADAMFGRGAGRDDLRVIHLSFDVAQVEFPLDGLQESRKVWNHVDELRVDAALSAHLARNGLRVGVAPASAWGPIRAILDAVGAQARRDEFVPQRGMPLAIELGELSEGDSVFSYSKSGRLTGKTFAGGAKIIEIDYLYHSEFGGSVDLGVAWEIRRDLGELTWETRNGVVQQTPAFDRHPFEELKVPVTLRRGEFLVLGLSADTRNKYLIGQRFLSTEREGKRFETLLMITPTAVDSAGARHRS